jgi:ABC-type sugar transport system substrate-binding protein
VKKPIILCIICLLAALLIMFYGFQTPQESAARQTNTLALLTQEDTGSFLLQLRYGAQAAAKEAQDTLTVATLAPDDLATQINALKEDGVKAVLLYGASDTLITQVRLVCEAALLPVVLLDREEPDVACVANDEAEAGALATRQALALGAKRLIFLTGENDVALERLRGAADALGEENAGMATFLNWAGADTQWTSVLQQAVDGGACIVTLTSEATLGAVQMLQDGKLTSQNAIIGMDPGSDRVTLLENGIVEGLVLPAPYAMGYSGYMAAEALLSGGQMTEEYTQPQLVTLDNLYNPENVKLAFPLLQ